MQKIPKVRKLKSGYILFAPTEEATKCKAEGRAKKWPHCSPPDQVEKDAVVAASNHGLSNPDKFTLQGFYELQIGQYRGQTFHWLMENDVGYAAYLICQMEREGGNTGETPINMHKHALKAYMQGFPDGRLAIRQKKNEMQRKAEMVLPRKKVSAASLVASSLSPAQVARQLQKPKVTPTATVSKAPDSDSDTSDSELVEAVIAAESQSAPIARSKDIPTLTELRKEVNLTGCLKQADTCPLPGDWKRNLPTVDHMWVSKALVTHNAQGKLEVQVNQLWYYPPQTQCNVTTGLPSVNRYFGHPLLCWMPRRIWKTRFNCPRCGRELVSAGPYENVREVLGLTGYYYAVTEELQCKGCQKRLLSWSQAILSQLDVAHRNQFPVLLTYKYACDISVVTLMRTRGLGNSAGQLRRKLVEEHSQEWSRKVMLYLADCQSILDSKLVTRQPAGHPPAQPDVPSAYWLRMVYCNDIMSRLDAVKAAITSTFGRVLKMDSTKKVTRKLTGQTRGTATWATNVGNEKGQVLMCVLTCAEGIGLGPMIKGLVNRYDIAGEPPPQVMYVDRDCCGDSIVGKLFHAWPNMVFRLDIWHFMRRFSTGCSTDAHILYPVFMSRLSKAIFEWSAEDLDALREAKRLELVTRNVMDPNRDEVIRWLTQKELATYCRRRTRGTEETTRLIDELVQALMGDEGKDTNGVPLFDAEVMTNVWAQQRKHVPCIQDPEGISLYTVTGTVRKAGMILTKYRCARGSVSLESFHNHLAKFIPGTTASDTHFQAYLLDGLMRWNEDREQESTGSSSNYSGQTQSTINELSLQVLGQKLVPNFRPPRKYTGEKIGLEYLFSQTGKVLQDCILDAESALGRTLEPEPRGYVELDEQGEDEGFEEMKDPTMSPVEVEPHLDDIPLQRPLAPSTPVRPPALSSMPSSMSSPSAPRTPVPSTSTVEISPASPTADTDGIPGYTQVEYLADYLYSLRSQSLSLTHDQALHIVRLWDLLKDFDKQPTVPSPRHSSRLTKVSTSTYKARNKQSVVPGVDTVNRTIRGENEGPAQKPDANRIMACLVIKLCGAFPSPMKQEGQRQARWTLVTRAYRHIRQLVLDSPMVMQHTGLQLFNVNNATLSNWYNDRIKSNERLILEQGFRMPVPDVTAAVSLPPAVRHVSATELPPIPPHLEHQFSGPKNLAGAASVKRQRLVPIRPKTDDHSDIPVQTTDPSPAAKSTLWYRKMQEKKQAAGEYVKRYQVRRSHKPYTCRKCGELRVPPGHTQYYGHWFCMKMADRTFEEWRKEKEERRQKKKMTEK